MQVWHSGLCRGQGKARRGSFGRGEVWWGRLGTFRSGEAWRDKDRLGQAGEDRIVRVRSVPVGSVWVR